MLYDVATKTTKDVYDAKSRRLGRSADLDGGRQADPVHDRRAGVQRRYAYDVATGKLAKVTDKTLIRGLSFTRDGNTVAFAMDTPNAPADVYVSDLTFASPRKLTDVNPQVRDLSLGETEVVTWKSADGTAVEGILIKRSDIKRVAGIRYSWKLTRPHGGVERGFKANWDRRARCGRGQGWAILYPNPRGSTGYGEKFTRANIMDGAAATTATS